MERKQSLQTNRWTCDLVSALSENRLQNRRFASYTLRYKKSALIGVVLSCKVKKNQTKPNICLGELSWNCKWKHISGGRQEMWKRRRWRRFHHLLMWQRTMHCYQDQYQLWSWKMRQSRCDRETVSKRMMGDIFGLRMLSLFLTRTFWGEPFIYLYFSWFWVHVDTVCSALNLWSVS